MLDKKYNFLEKEEKWMNYWLKNNIYKFDINSNKPVYSIDTPPPTVSGRIHIGHIFSYCQAEIIARYQRMKGKNVFYPFGFDDNGLPTERLVEKEHNIKAVSLSREEFTKLCLDVIKKYEIEFKNLFNRMGFSVDWNYQYQTINDLSVRISQKSFIELVKNKKAYYKESPTLWCTECGTSVAQAELESKTLKSTFNYIKFKTNDKDDFIIATTRPELLPACVAVFVNPNDEKNKYLVGKEAVVPLFDFRVPIIADSKVDLNKGTGIVMCCTFGDQTDIDWWKEYNLPLKNILTKDGYLINDINNYGGLKIKEARKRIIEDLQRLDLITKIEEIEHDVQTHERCGNEIEFTIVKQWFIDLLNYKQDFIDYGNKINWHPSHMKNRYINWVENLMWDWCISRQRFFGVPIPVWYCKKCGEIILADESELPVNPLKDKPNKPCPKCGSTEFIAEDDVLDTWATSSLTPLINMKWKEPNTIKDKLNPMSLRPNAHDIIRTWDFYTIVKHFFHEQNIPWENVMISGFALASEKEKISKRKNNSEVEPNFLINNFSSDVLRYWAASGKLGNNIIYSEETLQRGRKLVNKLWNVSKFILMHLEDYQKDNSLDNFEYMDKWIISKYLEMEEQYQKYLNNYEIGLALKVLEKFFWNFCDNYIEIVKFRLYRPEEFGNEARLSGQKTVYILLHKILQSFAIFFPFITEEIYQSYDKKEKSIHLTIFEELNYNFKETLENGDIIINLISDIRGEKTKCNVSLKTEISNLDIIINSNLEKDLKLALKDIKAILNINDFNIELDNEEKDYKIENIKMKI